MAKTVKKKMLYVDRDICVGCRYCVSVYPSIFELDKTNKSKIKENAKIPEKDFEKIANLCPVGAIKWR